MELAGRLAPSHSLETLPRLAQATVHLIDWARLGDAEARRLRELGFDEGVEVEVLHRARVGRGPVACRTRRIPAA